MDSNKSPNLGDILRAVSFLVALSVFLALIVGFGMRPGKISINFGPIDIEMERPTQESSGNNPALEIQSGPSPTTRIPTALPVIDYSTLDLRPYSELSAPETNLGLPPGSNTLNRIPFYNGWKVTTQCTTTADRPTKVYVDISVPNPLEVYVLFQAGWGTTPFNGMQVGTVNFYFSNGNVQTENLILGYNIRDWARNKPDAVNTVSSPMVAEAWRGTLPDGVIGGMDILTLPIQAKYQQSTLTRFSLLDTTVTTTGNLNPCVHLLAVTVKYVK